MRLIDFSQQRRSGASRPTCPIANVGCHRTGLSALPHTHATALEMIAQGFSAASLRLVAGPDGNKD